jgi:hypothetical protein
MNTEKHYVIVSNLQRFRNWAMDNIHDEDWSMLGARIHTPTKEYRAVTAMHHLRGAALTPETIHWTDGWFMGLSGRGVVEMESYVEMCLAAGGTT